MTWANTKAQIQILIVEGEDVPTTKVGKSRRVTSIDDKGTRIIMQTGKENKKYVTMEMLEWAYYMLMCTGCFTGKDLKEGFPTECKQGTCVPSMVGGIFEVLEMAKYDQAKHRYLKCMSSCESKHGE